MLEIFQEIQKIHRGESSEAVLAIVVHTSDSAPRHAGAKMLIRKDGCHIGSVGGGSVEKAVVDASRLILEKREPLHQLKNFNLGGVKNKADSDSTPTGMLCGGEMSVFMELITNPLRLLIFGGGHIGAALAPLAVNSGFAVNIFDDREEINASGRFGDDVKVQMGNPVESARNLSVTGSDQILIVTHNHKYDADILEVLLGKPAPFPKYIGMIGSSKKVSVVLKRMNSKGISQERINRVYTPVGLDIGADTPMELAVAIMGEILAVKNDRLTDDRVSIMRRRTRQE